MTPPKKLTDGEGYIELAKEMIDQALNDLAGTSFVNHAWRERNGDHKPYKAERRRYRDDTLKWFTGGNGEFGSYRWCLGMTGKNPNMMRKIIQCIKYTGIRWKIQVAKKLGRGKVIVRETLKGKRKRIVLVTPNQPRFERMEDVEMM